VNKELYEKFMRKNKSNPAFKDLTFLEFQSIIIKFNKELVNAIIDYPGGYELPNASGFIMIAAVKKGGKVVVDKGDGVEYTRQELNNIATNGHLCKIMYSNYEDKYRIKDKRIWTFKASKEFRKLASDAFVKNYKKYAYLDKKTKLVGFVTGQERDNYRRTVPSTDFINYDEFNF